MLLAVSVAEQVTVVTPSGNTSPDTSGPAAAHGADSTPSTASVAEPAEKVATAPAALVASTVTFAGEVTTGAVVSTTVTENDCDAERVPRRGPSRDRSPS